MWTISEVISGLYKLSQVNNEVAEKDQELGNSFDSTKSDIDAYKTQIEELYKPINDSASSVEDVTTARKNLMTVQDELIEKFGTEKDAIDLITNAVNGQTEAFAELTKKQWQETLNEFNDSGFWNNVGNFFNGYADNVDRMLDEYEHYTASIDLSKFAGFLGNKHYQEFQNLLVNKYGAEIKLDGTDTIAEISGNASEVYEKLLEIQNLSDDFEFNNAFSKDLTKLANSSKDVSCFAIRSKAMGI